jgi:hypothetical protein
LIAEKEGRKFWEEKGEIGDRERGEESQEKKRNQRRKKGGSLGFSQKDFLTKEQ